MQKRFLTISMFLLAAALVFVLWSSQTFAQAPPAQTPAAQPPAIPPSLSSALARFTAAEPDGPKKHVLVLAFTEGFHHGSTSDAAATIWQMGRDSGLWDTEIRTDTKWITKGSVGSGEARNLDWFDAIVAINTTGVWQLTDQQKKDFISAIHDDGKGFVAVHAALDANHNKVWPEFTEMVGGEFAAHPWVEFWAPVIVEDPSFPAMRPFTATHMTIYDEMYVPRADTWSRSKVNVLMRLNESKLPAETGAPEPFKSFEALRTAAGNAGGFGRGGAGAGGRGGAPGRGAANAAPRDNGVHPDQDYAMAWSKMYGKGRVYYSTLGHTKQAWQQPVVRESYLEAIKWVLGLTEGSTESHPKRN